MGYGLKLTGIYTGGRRDERSWTDKGGNKQSRIANVYTLSDGEGRMYTVESELEYFNMLHFGDPVTFEISRHREWKGAVTYYGEYVPELNVDG